MAKDFQQLTIKDSFMFAAVMADSEKCRRFIEIALDMKVLHVTVITEKALFYHPNYHSVRLDVLAEEHGTQRRFNVEMQVERLKCLPQRTRYYHAQMNMDILAAGLDYIHLPNTYVIFICDFSPFESGKRRYRYTFRNRCDEDGRELGDGSITVILSTKGENDSDVPKELLHFLKYVENPQHPAKDTVSDEYVRSLDRQIAAIKRNRNWEAKFVLFEEMMHNEREAGRLEGRQEGRLEGRQESRREAIIDLLQMHGTVPTDILDRINLEENPDILKQWHLAAARSASFEEFRKNI